VGQPGPDSAVFQVQVASTALLHGRLPMSNGESLAPMALSSPRIQSTSNWSSAAEEAPKSLNEVMLVLLNSLPGDHAG
jgi:hypothetical protein